MQDVESNIDDLFKKAADGYQPNIGDSGWEAVKPRLLNHTAIPAAPLCKNKRKNNKALLLLLLLPFTAGITFYFSSHLVKKPLAAISDFTSQVQTQRNNNTITSSKTIIHIDLKNNTQKNNVENINNIKQQQVNFNAADSHVSIQNALKTIVNDKNQTTQLPVTQNEISNLLPIEQLEEKTIVSNDTNTGNNQLPALKNIASATKQKIFYFGVVLGPAFNQVQNQGFKKASLNTGLLTGYKLNKNISFEAGLMYSKKYYFSDGKYFNMNKMMIASMPVGMKVLSLTGSSNVFEIPLSIQYNVVHTNISAVFVSGGISSYILTRENNNYKALVNSVQQNLKGKYKTISAGFASSIDVSAGYEHSLGKRNDIRIQPYVQIPLKGMGVGNIQVMSTGINIAVTRTFH